MATPLLFLIPFLLVENPSDYPVHQEKLENLFTEALQHFEEEIGPLSEPITLAISPDDCLRTGYNRKTKKVIFCPGPGIINAGLDSLDVMNHELFHAFLCEFNPKLCATDKYDYLHEALADKFAYELSPDQAFGENFYRGTNFIRSYHSTWRVGLVKSDHERGTALASEFIRTNKKLKNLVEFFGHPEPLSEVEVKVEGRPASTLNRYRLTKDEVLKLSFQFSPAAKVESLKWELPEGASARQTGKSSFGITVNSRMKESKSYVIFMGQDGEELGREAFYFGSTLAM
jgi:hypothetical protein